MAEGGRAKTAAPGRRRPRGAAARAASEEYFAAIETFTAWCALRGCPFRQEMVKALQRFMEEDGHGRPGSKT